MSFIQSHQDKINIYFILEYVRGIELFDVIRDKDFTTGLK